MGFSEDYLQKSRPLRREAIRRLRSNLSSDEEKTKSDETERRMLPLMGKEDKQLYEKLKAGFDAGSELRMAGIRSPWMQFMLRYDPAADLQRVKCPVLALNGQLDTQVRASQNLPAIEKNLKEGGNTQFTVKELKGLNHLFQTAQTGDTSEYDEIEESFSPSALSEILTWLNVNAKTSE